MNPHQASCITSISCDRIRPSSKGSHASRPNGVFLLLSVSRNASPHRQSIARIILATTLLLVVLASAVPFSSLASSHACAMACCIGKPPHMAGSCSVQFSDEEQAETPPERNEEQPAHHQHAMHPSGGDSQAIASAKHQDAAKPPATHHSKSGTEVSSRTTSVASQPSLTTPCSPECAAVASVYSQVRRPRDSASVAVVARPRPPTFLSFDDYQARPLPKSSECRRLSRPRAPPALLNNLSA